MSAPFVEEITTDPGIPSEVPEPGQKNEGEAAAQDQETQGNQSP